MFDNAQSGDEKVTQILGECAMVYATKIHGPKIVCVYLPAQIIYVLLFIIFDILIFIYYSQMWCTSTWDLLHSVKMMGIAKCTEGLKALPWSVYLQFLNSVWLVLLLPLLGEEIEGQGIGKSHH